MLTLYPHGSDFSSNLARTRLAARTASLCRQRRVRRRAPQTWLAQPVRQRRRPKKDKPLDAPAPARKAQSKKRKRTSIANESDQPAAKLTRTEDSVKEEDVQETHEPLSEEHQTELPSSGDVPIRTEDAEKILEVLETYVCS